MGAGFDAVQLSSDTHNAHAGLKALGRDPRLHGIRPASTAPLTLQNIASSEKYVPSIRYVPSPSVFAVLLAGPSHAESTETNDPGAVPYFAPCASFFEVLLDRVHPADHTVRGPVRRKRTYPSIADDIGVFRIAKIVLATRDYAVQIFLLVPGLCSSTLAKNL